MGDNCSHPESGPEGRLVTKYGGAGDSGQHPFPQTLVPWRNILSGMARSTSGAKFGDISIDGTVKEQQTKLRRQQFARREAEAAIAVAEIEASRFARLPWLVRAIGAVLDFVFRRPIL